MNKLGVWDELTGGFIEVDSDKLVRALKNLEFIKVDKATEEVLNEVDGATDVNPTHYDFPGGVQVIDITKHLDFLTGNVVKYVSRAGRKGDRLTDLLKAEKYLRWAIEKEQSEKHDQ